MGDSMRGFFLRASLLLVFVGVGATAGQPAYAGGFLPTKAAWLASIASGR